MQLLSSNESEESPRSTEAVSQSEQKDLEYTPVRSGRKNGSPKGSGSSVLNSVNKIVSQIKKPPHRRSCSPSNWHFRKKGDTYLQRKIKFLQENEGMNLSLDETLGNANPHYTKIAREKIAAREAANKAMAARKNAMIEGSWCRILKAARIQSKEAEAELEKAEKSAAEAFEAARAKGVMMYDTPDTARKSCEVESHSSLGGKSTHTVTASFETAFEVDREVMAAIKKSFIQYANCPGSYNKEEFKDLMWKISQNPENIESELESSEISPELVNNMLERLKKLQEEELSSLATVVATCGLNAALLKLENSNKDCAQRSRIQRRISSANSFIDGFWNRKETDSEMLSLDKFLVKNVSKLEKEVKNNSRSSDYEYKSKNNNDKSVEPALDLGSILVKHVSKLEKEIQEAKKLQTCNSKKEECKENVDSNSNKELNLPSLGDILIKPTHKLDEVKMEASRKEYEFKKRNNHQSLENMESLDAILVKHQSKLEKEKIKFAACSKPPTYENVKNKRNGTVEVGLDSLEKVLLKHKPEAENTHNNKSEDYCIIKHASARKEARERDLLEAWGGLSLGNSGKPHISRLERDRAACKRAEEEEQKAKQVVE